MLGLQLTKKNSGSRPTLAKARKFCRNFECYATAQRCKQRHRPESGIVAKAMLLACATGKFEQNSLELMTQYSYSTKLINYSRSIMIITITKISKISTYMYYYILIYIKFSLYFMIRHLMNILFRFSKIVCKIHSNNARNSLSITAGFTLRTQCASVKMNY